SRCCISGSGSPLLSHKYSSFIKPPCSPTSLAAVSCLDAGLREPRLASVLFARLFLVRSFLRQVSRRASRDRLPVNHESVRGFRSPSSSKCLCFSSRRLLRPFLLIVDENPWLDCGRSSLSRDQRPPNHAAYEVF